MRNLMKKKSSSIWKGKKKKKTVLHTSHTQCWDPNKLVKFSSLEGRRERWRNLAGTIAAAAILDESDSVSKIWTCWDLLSVIYFAFVWLRSRTSGKKDTVKR